MWNSGNIAHAACKPARGLAQQLGLGGVAGRPGSRRRGGGGRARRRRLRWQGEGGTLTTRDGTSVVICATGWRAPTEENGHAPQTRTPVQETHNSPRDRNRPGGRGRDSRPRARRRDGASARGVMEGVGDFVEVGDGVREGVGVRDGDDVTAAVLLLVGEFVTVGVSDCI